MNREDLQLSVIILEENNLIKAAELLYMSPSTAGSKLRTTEEELGFELFGRRRGVKTTFSTPRGQEFPRLSAQILTLWNETDQIRRHCESPFLTIAAVGSFLSHNLTPLYRELVLAHEFSPDIKCYPVDMIYSLVSSKQANISFALYRTDCPYVNVVPIMEGDMVLVVSKRQPALRGSSENRAPVHPSSLAPDKELLIGPRFNSNMGWGPEFRLWHDRYINPQARPFVAASSISILTGLLRAGGYWTIMPSTTANGLREQYPISVLSLFPSPPGRTLYMLTHESPPRISSGNTELFIRYLREYLKMHNSEGYLMEQNVIKSIFIL